MYYNKAQAEAPVIQFLSNIIGKWMDNGNRQDQSQSINLQSKNNMDRLERRHSMNLERDRANAQDAMDLAKLREKRRQQAKGLGGDGIGTTPSKQILAGVTEADPQEGANMAASAPSGMYRSRQSTADKKSQDAGQMFSPGLWGRQEQAKAVRNADFRRPLSRSEQGREIGLTASAVDPKMFGPPSMRSAGMAAEGRADQNKAAMNRLFARAGFGKDRDETKAGYGGKSEEFKAKERAKLAAQRLNEGRSTGDKLMNKPVESVEVGEAPNQRDPMPQPRPAPRGGDEWKMDGMGLDISTPSAPMDRLPPVKKVDTLKNSQISRAQDRAMRAKYGSRYAEAKAAMQNDGYMFP